MRANLRFDHEGGPNRRFRPSDVSAVLAAPPATPVRLPRVLLAGKLTALAAPGGGETQLLAMARALPAAGVNARLWRPWEDSLAGVDCLHLFGSLPEHAELVATAHNCGVPVALSTIAWFDGPSLWREPRSLAWRLTASAKFWGRALCPRISSWRRRLYQSVDLLLPNSRAEADQLVRYFGVPKHRIHVVPNGADERFAEGSPAAFARLAGGRGFVLYPGRIEPRKNQLGFLKAMQGTDTSIVILGDVVPGQERYLDACRRAAGDKVKFIGRVGHDSPLLASAYAACGCVALASWFETPGLVALEAGMSGVPLVLPNVGAAPEYFGNLAEYVAPNNPREIRAAVLRSLQRGRSPALARCVRREFSWRAAADATREAYAKLA